MRNLLESTLGNHSIYKARRQEFETGEKIPFRVSPKPLELTASQTREMHAIGADVTNYFGAVDQLYRTDGRVQSLLNTGKPEIFLTDQTRPTDYLFVRPDLIITPSGFSICEVETSPFGLALAEILNRGYRQAGFETLVGDGTLPEYVQANTPIEGSIIYSKKTSSYSGQMTFLADEVFSGEGRSWQARHVEEPEEDESTTIYRGFYLSESLSDAHVGPLLAGQMAEGKKLLPSPTPHMEEKANLALIWDRRFEPYFQTELGQGAFNHLRDVIPPTWIVGQEEHFALGLPHGIASTVDLATLSRAKRAYVVKPSGFGENASWAEGVSFLHQQSPDRAKASIQKAAEDTAGLHVVQEFRKGAKVPLTYQGPQGEEIPMQARIRLTPYFSVAHGQEGQLVAIKATGCENTDFIHASSASINTAVS